jgi:hypothetical protein
MSHCCFRSLVFAGLMLGAPLLIGCGDVGHILYGYVNMQGGWDVPPEYDQALPFSESLAVVGKRRGYGYIYGYIDTAGRTAVPLRYDEAKPFSEGLAAVAIDDAWSFIDSTGRTVAAGPFEDAHPFFAGLAAIQIGGKWGFVDHSGAPAIAPRFDELHESLVGVPWSRTHCFREDRCAAREGALWGYIDRSGGWAVPPRFADTRAFSEGLAAVREQSADGPGNVGFIDRHGDWVIPPRFEEAMHFSGGRAIALTRRSALGPDDSPASPDDEAPAPVMAAVLIDSTGTEIADVGWEPLLDSFVEAAAALDSLMPDYLVDGLIPASRGHRWGFMDRDGKWLIDPRFDFVLPFRKGLAAVGLSDDPPGDYGNIDRWGVIDIHGSWVIEPELSGLGFPEGPLIPARLHARWGLLDRDGRWRVPPIHAEKNDWLELPLFEQPAGDGLQRMGVYANHSWVVTDRLRQINPPREFQWLQPLRGLQQGDTVRLTFRQGGLWGLADARMNTIVGPDFDDVPTLSGGLIEIKLSGRIGCIDDAGRMVVPAEFSALEHCDRHRVRARRGSEWGTWTPETGWRTGEQAAVSVISLADAIYVGGSWWVKQAQTFVLHRDDAPVPGVDPVDEVRKIFMGPDKGVSGWVGVVRRGAHWGVIDAAGHERVPLRYEAIGKAFDSLFAVRLQGRWGIVDDRDEQLFPTRYSGIEPFSRDVAIVCEEQLCGLIDRMGILLPPRYPFIKPISPEFAQIGETDAAGDVSSTGILDVSGRVRVAPQFVTISEFSPTLWRAQHAQAGTQLLSKATGEPVPGLPQLRLSGSQLSDGLIAALLETRSGKHKYGYLDDHGRIAIAPRFDVADPFVSGVALVTIAGRCGAIDKRGITLVPLEYDHCEQLPDGSVIAGVERGAP